MAIKKASSESPTIFRGASNPNTAKAVPGKPGDLFIDTTNKIFYVACGFGTTDWGTGGTIGA